MLIIIVAVVISIDVIIVIVYTSVIVCFHLMELQKAFEGQVAILQGKVFLNNFPLVILI
jgi:hypothetical protein